MQILKISDLDRYANASGEFPCPYCTRSMKSGRGLYRHLLAYCKLVPCAGDSRSHQAIENLKQKPKKLESGPKKITSYKVRGLKRPLQFRPAIFTPGGTDLISPEENSRLKSLEPRQPLQSSWSRLQSADERALRRPILGGRIDSNRNRH
jgi:hypothetical protein